MLTLTLQTLGHLLKLVFVLLAVDVVRRTYDRNLLTSASWRWTAVAFLVSGMSGIIHAFWAVAAFRSGAGTAVYSSFLAWTPAMNYSRYGVAVLLGFGLIALTVWPAFRLARPGTLLLVCIAAAMLGVLAGLAEGPLVVGRHVTNLAVMQVVETAALFLALFAAVWMRSMDTWLWLALFVYALRQALNGLVWAATSWEAMPDAWVLPYWASPLIGVTMWLMMIGLVAHRSRLARQNIPVNVVFTQEPETTGGLPPMPGSTGIGGPSRP